MRDEVTKHIDEVLASIRAIYEKAAERIETLPQDGKSKIPGTTLAKELGEEIGIAGPTLYPTMLMFYKGYPGTVLRKGAHGGIVRLAPDQPAAADEATDSTDEKDSE